MDIVVVDQRGTWHSNALHCAQETETRPASSFGHIFDEGLSGLDLAHVCALGLLCIAIGVGNCSHGIRHRGVRFGLRDGGVGGCALAYERP